MRLAWIREFASKKRLSIYLYALWKLFKHPQTPRAAKWTAIAVVAYAISPIDLIPDVIPILGMLDELVLVPLGVWLVIRLTPPALWKSILADAEAHAERVPRMVWGAIVIVAIWALLLGLASWWAWNWWQGG
jgi:uncharacterized membrane protein YkvA (DUF1232 family)